MKKKSSKIPTQEFREQYALMSGEKSSSVLNYSPELALRERLRTLVRENLELPIEARRSKYEILVEAGYPEQKAKAICNILVEGDKETHIKKRGFDENSAKIVVAEIAHDEAVESSTRLKAAETMFKALGVYKDDGGNNSASIMAQLLADMFKASEGRPKIIRAEIIQPDLISNGE